VQALCCLLLVLILTRTVFDKDPVTHFKLNTQKPPALHDMRGDTKVISPIYFLRNCNYTDIETYRCIK
jgi:hypothetical protein